MFATFPRTRNQRRGVVLILVLGMLGLLALIGVTFATFSGQVKINARNFSQAQNWPESTEMMDYALAQLIDDTDNPQSAIRGHSLKRDMYGNDGLYNSALAVNPANGLRFAISNAAPVPAPALGAPPTLVSVTDIDGTVHNVCVDGLIQVNTNIASNEPALYGYNFTRWVMRFPPVVDSTVVSATEPAAYYPSETHEILADVEGTGGRVFYVAPDDRSRWPGTTDVALPPQGVPLESPRTYGTDYSQAPIIPYPLPKVYGGTDYQPDADYPPIQNYNYYNYDYVTNLKTATPGQSTLVGLRWRTLNNTTSNLAGTFTLDGRFLHAFNGPGVSGLDQILDPVLGSKIAAVNAPALQNRGMAQYANFRTNGNILTGNINTKDNFLTPFSYGSPSICGMDEDYDACDLENWFLAMQSGDGQVMIPSFHRPGILISDQSVTAPTKNDPLSYYDDWTSQNPFSASKILRPRQADGHSALAFPNLHPDPNGKIQYDVDNDGDGNSDSVWLDLGYPARRNTDGRLFKPLFAFMVIGLNGRIPLNTAGNLQLRSLLGQDPVSTLQHYGVPLLAHASGKGYSPSEVDPTYALQNAFMRGAAGVQLYSPTDNAGGTAGGVVNGAGVYTAGDATNDFTTYANTQWWGNAGVPVSLTQLRNLLAGTRSPGLVKNASGVEVPTSGDSNFVFVNGKVTYLPNGVLDAGDASTTTTTTPIAGRWGEPADQPVALSILPLANAINVAAPPLSGWAPASPIYQYENQVRAGVSGQWTAVAGTLTPRYGDARDDNRNTFDWYPSNTGGGAITTLGENADFLDLSGSLVLPVERLRRFVTPIDVMGDGIVNSLVNPFSTAIGTVTPLLGGDKVGRVAYVKHFRPPGLVMATPPGLDLPAAPLPTTAPAIPTKPIWYPYESGAYWLQGIGKPAPPMNSAPVGVAPTQQVVPVDLTNNLYHGFESYRMPTPPGNIVTLSQFIGGMPSNTFPDPTVAPLNSWAPRFDQSINTLPVINPNAFASSSYPWLASLNEADEMNVYSPQSSDQPFGPSDLEWLYRQQDTDGLSLASRLKDLAPVSFTNPKDGTRRRRLFSIESWEPTNFVWANDNPAGDPQWPLVTETNAPYGNSQFYATANASGANLSLKDATLSTIDYLHGFHADAYDSRMTSPGYTVPRRLPSLAHRDRKINLNYPLPVSNRYDEPVRQKWIRETYQLLKMILPPKAVDTPEELVQLSQYVTNIIDFRDPDCTSTRFVNTDVYYATAATATEPATLAFTPPGGVPNSQLGLPWNGTNNVPPPSYSQLYDNQNSPYVIQYGMEYNPVAITEVLAYTFQYSGAPAPDTPRMWVELVNTLTAPAPAPTATNPAGSDPKACDLKLDGWDFIILPDTPAGRPDPFTGQLPMTTLPPAAPTPPLGVTVSNKKLASIGTTDPGGLTNPIRAITNNAPKAYVIQDAALSSGIETSPPTADATIDLVNNTNLQTATTGNYYWLYLRRPANPFDTSYDPARPNENRVVVDCFRFLYNKTTAVGSGGTVSPTPADGTLYSQRRLQPFRGGHAVPPIPPVVGAVNYCVPAYGYTEQPIKGLSGDTGSHFKGNWTAGASSTGAIYNTLGKAPGEETQNKDDYDWDMMQFNDRDFTSVAELLMVPGCPPGLFTKQFVELAPPIPVNPPTMGGTPPPLPTLFTNPSAKVTAGSTGVPATTSEPHTFPYLMDEFFYTAQSEPSIPGSPIPTMVTWPVPPTGPAPIHQTPNFNATFPIAVAGTLNANFPVVPNYIGGPSGAGWFRMFEFFDVPSPANGSTGLVADGTNYDWARQDLKPGLLNLNLIIDEEVFFAVMSESWLKTLGYVRNFTPPFFSPAQEDIDNMGATRLNVQQLNLSNAAASPPQAVTQVNVNGFPNSTYQMPNQGFMALDPLASYGSTVPIFDNRMKAAFSDFLKLRHGGSGYMFAHQTGHVGDPDGTTTLVASERPFHALSYPNVDYTVMRPAALPPTDSTTYAPWQPAWATLTTAKDGSTAPYPTYVGDPGVKNPYLFTQNNPVSPPPVPARRLFQLPDVWGNPTFYLTAGAINFPAPPGGTDPAVYPGNASNWPSTHVGATVTANFTGDPFVNWQNLNANLANTAVDLSAIPTTVPAGATPPAPYVFVPNFYLGANTTVNPPAPTDRNDNRQHPAFRSDWLHKVTNLTTVRTHQYAVWITVGFFEVTKQGDPTIGNAAPGLAYDHLGQELNIQNGKNVRYRSFFIIDRTRAVGFSPQAPGNFRDCITYRQTIE